MTAASPLDTRTFIIPTPTPQRSLLQDSLLHAMPVSQRGRRAAGPAMVRRSGPSRARVHAAAITRRMYSQAIRVCSSTLSMPAGWCFASRQGWQNS